MPYLESKICFMPSADNPSHWLQEKKIAEQRIFCRYFMPPTSQCHHHDTEILVPASTEISREICSSLVLWPIFLACFPENTT